jgi:hypothetical protein
MKKMLVGLLSVFAMLIVAPMLDTGNVVHAQWDGPGLSPDVCDDDPNAFCITQIRRTKTARTITVRGVNPTGVVRFIYRGGTRNGTWVAMYNTANQHHPYDALAMWGENALNTGDFSGMPLWGRPELMFPLKEQLYFARLHVMREFYIGWGLDVDWYNPGNVNVYVEGGWADTGERGGNGGYSVRRMFFGNGCSAWVNEQDSGAEYHDMANATADFLNDGSNGYEFTQIIPEQADEYIEWLLGIRNEYPIVVDCGFEEPPQLP